MPRKCSIDGCKSNYDSAKKNCSTFSLPRNEPLRSQWIQKIPTDLSKLKHPVICIKHFDESSIIRTDVIFSKGERKEYPRIIPKLKEGTVPSIFPLRKYSNTHKSSISKRHFDESPVIGNDEIISNVERKNSRKLPHPRKIQKLENSSVPFVFPCVSKYLITRIPSTSKALTYGVEECNQQVVAQNFKDKIEKDTIKCLSDISYYVANKNNLQNWVLQRSENFLMLRYIDSKNVISDILGTIAIDNSLDVSVYIKKCEIEKSKLPFKKQKLISFNALDNLMIFLEKEVMEVTEPHIDNIDLAIKLLMQHNDYDNSKYFKFIVEQLKLLKMPKEGRRFCNNTMLFASALYLHSLSAYNLVRESGLMLIPHPKHVEKVISKLQLE